MVSSPEYFWLLLVIVPLLAVMIHGFFRGKKSLISLAGKWRPPGFYDLYTVKYFFVSFGFIVFIVFTVLSLVGFPGREYPVTYEPSGTDIVFAVDISESMKAADISPSRLEMSKRIIRSVCESSRGGRFGIVIFRGTGINIIPVTEDRESIFTFLEFLGSDLMTSPGTDIQSGLEAAVEAFPGGEERRRVIVLLSDGEALSGDMDGVLETAADRNIQIYAVGTATAEGAPVPSDNGFLTDASGTEIISRLDEAALEKAAAAGGGRYYPVSSAELLPDLIELGSGKGINPDEGYRIERKERYVFFLIFALLGLAVSRITKVVKWKDYF